MLKARDLVKGRRYRLTFEDGVTECLYFSMYYSDHGGGRYCVFSSKSKGGASHVLGENPDGSVRAVIIEELNHDNESL